MPGYKKEKINRSMATGGESSALEEIIATDEFYRRPSRSPDYEAENGALVALAQEVVCAPGSIFRKLTELALDLCAADTVGVSLLEQSEDDSAFRWVAIAGEHEPHLRGMTRRDFSPCRTCLARGAAQLFLHPGRYYTYCDEVEPPIIECLVLPFYINGEPVGTIWAVAHSEERKFDGEDLRVLQSLGNFASIAVSKQREEELLRESEERYRISFESIDEGFCVGEMLFDDAGKPIDCRILEINPAFERMTGVKRVAGKTARELIPNLEADWIELCGKVVLTGAPAHVENRAEAINRWFDCHVFRLGGEGSQKFGLRFLDIAERKRAEEALRSAHNRITNVFESMTDCFYALDADWRFTYVNPQTESYFGFSKETMLGRRYMEVLPKTRGHEILTKQQEAMVEQKAIQFETLSPTTGKWVKLHVFPAKGELAVYFRDITERKQQKDKLRETAQKLEQQSRIFDTTLSSITDFAYIFDKDGRFVYSNQALLDLLGITIDEIVGKNFFDLNYPPDLAERLQRQIQRVFQTKEKLVDETPFTSPVTGAVGYYEYIFSPVIAADRAVELVAGSTRDITGRKQMEELLRESEERSRLAIEAGQFGTYRYDFRRAAGKGSSRAWEMFGFKDKEAASLDEWIERIHPEDRARISELFAQVANGASDFNTEYRIIKPDGATRWISDIGSLTCDGVGKPLSFNGIVADITGRKAAEQSLSESEARFRAAFEQANIGIVQSSFDGRLLLVNPGFSHILGYKGEEARGRMIRDITHPDDYEKEEELTRQLVIGEISGYSLEKRYLHKDGRVVCGQMTTALVRQASGEPYYILSIVEDITERKRAGAELKKINEQLEERIARRTAELMEMNASLQAEITERRRAECERASILRRLVMAQEDERRRIAREMHDQFGQQLTALILKLGMLKEDCGEQKRLCEQVDALEEVARQLDWDVDFLVWELRPTALDDLGLQDALSNYAQNWSQHVGVPVDVHTGGMGKVRLTSEIEITLYRIAQEALNNVAKHARAASASILLERHTDTISLIVEDDGIGFEADNTSAGNDKGLGLVGIRERAALVGGTVEIESHPGDGTTVYVRIPAPLVALKGERHE
jgi:PAS domain S-box-containing protein